MLNTFAKIKPDILKFKTSISKYRNINTKMVINVINFEKFFKSELVAMLENKASKIPLKARNGRYTTYRGKSLNMSVLSQFEALPPIKSFSK